MTVLARRAMLLAPLGLVAAGGVGLYAMLDRMKEGKFDPRGVPSALIGHPLPSFSLPGQDGAGFSSTDVTDTGKPVLVNFFASWCVPCVAEAGVLMQLRQAGTKIFGIAYKDKQAATADFLSTHGDPYARIARDASGSVAIDFGLYGVPETYLVDGKGIVRWRLAGPLSDDIVQRELFPIIRSLA